MSGIRLPFNAIVVKRPTSAPPDEEVQRLLTEVVHPATYTQIASYAAMGLRQRILTLPVMVAFVLSLTWRQVGSVSEAVRELKRQGMLWAEAHKLDRAFLYQQHVR